MNEQKKFNQLLLERLDQQQEYINNKLEERDRKLMESIRTLQKTKKEVAAATSRNGESFGAKNKKGS
ncbi:DUF3967 domain-containing protein [Bacillus cereus]|nr:DUF3967 domain-containing protein [Bacillus cereus]